MLETTQGQLQIPTGISQELQECPKPPVLLQI